jgi:ubiquinone/menaquinone biosynthesis C-methylase UbiE
VTREDWDAAANTVDGLPPGWRRHARLAHLSLINSWIGDVSGVWLKTDLYEETMPTRALVPHLSGSWVGMDISPEVVRRTEDLVSWVVACDVRRLPFRDAAFDGILSTSTLDHFSDPDDIFRSLIELRRVLRPEGRLILTLDNPSNPLIRLRNALPERLREATGLVPFFVGSTLSDREGKGALKKAGFRVMAVRYLLHAPHVIGTRPAGFEWFERRVLPVFDRLERTRLARYTGHYVAFLCGASGS